MKNISKLINKIYVYMLSNIRKINFFSQWEKKIIFHKMQKVHQHLLQQIKGKEKIKVVFLAIHKSVWKVDPVFQKMLNDPFFEPIILVCPYILHGEERMLEDMEQAYSYFIDKGYPVRKSLKEDGSWYKLDEIKPDIVFFTNPHDLTRKEYYQDAYLNYLSCYVPYHHEVGSHGDISAQYNQLFHNAMWRIFSTQHDSYLCSKSTAASKGKNVCVTGFPAMEKLTQLKAANKENKVWKNNDNRKRIIWAPHHTIVEEWGHSNFLEYADFIVELAQAHKNNIVWAFKPHPILKSKLYIHPSWGRKKTEEYYKFWKEQNFTQLETGQYEGLFLESDAMIHDCGSFLAEYLYTEKPVLYLLNKNNHEHFFNSFGKKALSSCRIGRNKNDIEEFVKYIVSENGISILDTHDEFLNKEIMPYFKNGLPSELIIKYIKSGMKQLIIER